MSISDDGVIEIGTFRMPDSRAERKAIAEEASGMPTGVYRVVGLSEAGRVNPLLASLAFESEPGTWHVLDRVSVARIVNAGGVRFVPDVVYDAQRERLAIGDSVVKSSFSELRHIAEDLIVPGFSLLDRVGEAVSFAGNDKESIEGTLVHWEGDHAVVQLASGELVALSEERSEALQGKGYDTHVRVEDTMAEDTSRTLDGAALSLEIFGG